MTKSPSDMYSCLCFLLNVILKVLKHLKIVYNSLEKLCYCITELSNNTPDSVQLFLEMKPKLLKLKHKNLKLRA